MHDMTTEELVSLKEALEHFPGRKKVAIATIYRWWQVGIRGVKLETLVVGVNRYTSLQAIKRFIAAQNAEGIQPPQKSPPRKRRTKAAIMREEVANV